MRSVRFRIVATAVAAAASFTLAASAAEFDLRRVAAPEAHMVVLGHYNPERNAERAYAAEAFKTWSDERIGERFIEIITSQAPPDKLDHAKNVLAEFKTALGSMDCEALFNAPECVYVQQFEGIANQHLLAVRLSSADAADYETGMANVLKLLAQKSEGKVQATTAKIGAATVTTLELPKESPIQPAVGRVGDIVLIGSNEGLLKTALERLQAPSGDSKFDDPRLVEALKSLPKPEDSLVFFDGRQLFQQLRTIGPFIREKSKDDKDAARFAALFDRIIDETAILDYEVTVEYTEDGHHRSAKLGQLTDDAQEKILGKVVASGEPIEDWGTWIPADATAYSVSGGCNLHALYEGIVKFAKEEFPESAAGFAKFDEKQNELGVHLDQDVLQAFPGPHACVTVPVKGSDGAVKSQDVSAYKCTNSDRIRELLNRAVAGLNKIPAIQAQQLQLVNCEGLDGFQEVHAAFMTMFGATPVIGFRDDWMIVGASRAAVEKVLAVREGKAESIDKAASFEKLRLNASGSIFAVSYKDVGAGVRNAADGIDKVGAMAPMFIGMAAQKAKPEQIKALTDLAGLLPSIAKVVRKFDYFDHQASVTRKGPLPHSYLCESVTEIRPAKATP